NLNASTAIRLGESNNLIGIGGLSMIERIKHVGACELQQSWRHIPLSLVIGMHRHCLLVTADDDAPDHHTAGAFKRHAASDPDLLQCCRGSLMMQELQTLDDAGVEFDEGRLVEALDIDLRHAVTPSVRCRGHHAKSSAGRQSQSHICPTYHCHRFCPCYPAAIKRLITLSPSRYNYTYIALWFHHILHCLDNASG